MTEENKPESRGLLFWQGRMGGVPLCKRCKKTKLVRYKNRESGLCGKCSDDVIKHPTWTTVDKLKPNQVFDAYINVKSKLYQGRFRYVSYDEDRKVDPYRLEVLSKDILRNAKELDLEHGKYVHVTREWMANRLLNLIY